MIWLVVIAIIGVTMATVGITVEIRRRLKYKRLLGDSNDRKE